MSKRQTKSHRISTKGPLIGQCNICGEEGPLTDDHTPPKSCSSIRDIEVRSLHDKLSDGGEESHRPRRFQAGVSFRSLCERCNTLLGSQYDPALADFCLQVRSLANSTLHLRDVISIEIQPQAVMRSVLGHMAAQGAGRYRKGPMTEPLRDYILDAASPLPAPIRMYYWLYPFREQVLVRDAVRLNIANSATVSIWLLKFFPLAFLATLDEPPERQFHVNNLDTFRDIPNELRQIISLRLRPIVHRHWPEAPDDGTVLLYGPQALSGDPRTRIHRT
jgi:hypothetical protein